MSFKAAADEELDLEYGDDYKWAHDVYDEICICDTPLCNVASAPRDYFCHGGDFKQSEVLENPLLLNQTHSCYTNRNQCFIMKYQGKNLKLKVMLTEYA